MRATNDTSSSRIDRPGERGFTMVELLITLVVSLIGLAGMLALSRSLSTGNRSTLDASDAVQIAETTLEEVRQQPVAAIIADHGATPIDVELAPAYGRNDTEYVRRLRVEEVAGASDLYRTRVEVTWGEGGAEIGSDDGEWDRTVVLETIRTWQEGL